MSAPIPTRPREGRLHSRPAADSVIAALLTRVLLGYSYFQSGSSGCLMSQRGRRLKTTGIVAKLYSGGGELVDHSRVHASQGSFPAIGPLNLDQNKLATNTRMATP